MATTNSAGKTVPISTLTSTSKTTTATAIIPDQTTVLTEGLAGLATTNSVGQTVPHPSLTSTSSEALEETSTELAGAISTGESTSSKI